MPAVIKLAPLDSYVNKIRATKTISELQAVFISVRNEVRSNAAYTSAIEVAKNEMKSIMESSYISAQ